MDTVEENLQGGVPSPSHGEDPEVEPEKKRRASIQMILKDPNLTNEQRNQTIQILMDGRRRSGFGLTFEEAAQNVRAEFLELDDLSDDPTDKIMKSDDSKKCNVGDSSNRDSTTSADSVFKPDQYDLNIFNKTALIGYDLKGEKSGCPKAMEENRPSCSHYNRKCTIISPCCGMAFGCRICHDECEQQEIPFMNALKSNKFERERQIFREFVPEHKRNNSSRRVARRISLTSVSEMTDDIHHDIDRLAIEEIICRLCFTRQSSKTNQCVNCNVQFGEYHCDICNLWMDQEGGPYHCEKCGICRVGGKDNFVHCDGCGMCIDKQLFNGHNCRSGKLIANCPVCYEDLFSTRFAFHELPCGHSIHWHCYNELSKVDIRCPICKKTTIDCEERQEVWRGLAEDIAMQPLPPSETRAVTVYCNDCEVHEESRRWHPLGIVCNHCSSYNTTFEITMTGIEANTFLNNIERSNDKEMIIQAHGR